jgi:WD40 repeat protein
VLAKTKLDPPLRGDINYLHFSPDGRYILAQDDSGIDVVTREPLAHFLHIDAPEARPAQFTPDSKGLVFYNQDLRVEEWDVEAKKLKSAKELFAREGCIQTALAPDGRTLACLDGKFALSLYDMEKDAALGTVKLPRNPLGRLRAAAVSPDLKWLAVSERSRGAVWDLTKGSRLFHTRGFRAAHFAQGCAYVDFPKYEESERALARLDLASGQAFEHRKLGDAPVWQRGGYSVLRKPLKKGGGLDQNVTLTVSDTLTGTPFWSRDFQKEAPRVFVDEYAGTMVFSWSVKSDHAKAEIKAPTTANASSSSPPTRRSTS